MISAGDNGSAGCDPGSSTANQDAAVLGIAVSGIASTPYNIAMGGTDFDDVGNQSKYWNTANTATTTPPAVPASALGYIPEKTWNDSTAGHQVARPRAFTSFASRTRIPPGTPAAT